MWWIVICFSEMPPNRPWSTSNVKDTAKVAVGRGFCPQPCYTALGKHPHIPGCPCKSGDGAASLAHLWSWLETALGCVDMMDGFGGVCFPQNFTQTRFKSQEQSWKRRIIRSSCGCWSNVQGVRVMGWDSICTTLCNTRVNCVWSCSRRVNLSRLDYHDEQCLGSSKKGFTISTAFLLLEWKEPVQKNQIIIAENMSADFWLHFSHV